MSEIPPIDVGPEHWELVRAILGRHVPQCEVWAFGSRVTGLAKPFSDLDLVVVTQEPLPLDLSAAMAEDFSESDLPWKVDVVDWARSSDAFRRIIERNRVVVQKATPPTPAPTPPASDSTRCDPDTSPRPNR